MFKPPWFYFIMVPKHQSSDAGHSIREGSWKGLPVREKLNVLDSVGKEKYHRLKLPRSTVRRNLTCVPLTHTCPLT